MGMNQKVTILDIAKEANVSASTVSRVLRGSATVAEEKQTAVRQAVKALNYRPNVFAQSLASGQSMSIGVLTQNFGSPFYDEILQGILQGLDETGYSPIFADGRWQKKIEEQAVQMFIDRRVDGMIHVGGQLPVSRLLEINQQIPLIVVGRNLEDPSIACLTINNFDAAYEATQYLISMGHQKIAHITASVNRADEVNDIRERLLGYQQALRDAGIDPDPNLVVAGDLLPQSGVFAVHTLREREQHFSAIFCANDQMAFGARLALSNKGFRVPEDVSLIGFDDISMSAYMNPPLTTVQQPAIELGRAAAYGLLQLIDEKPLQLATFSGQLIERQSVARYR